MEYWLVVATMEWRSDLGGWVAIVEDPQAYVVGCRERTLQNDGHWLIGTVAGGHMHIPAPLVVLLDRVPCDSSALSVVAHHRASRSPRTTNQSSMPHSCWMRCATGSCTKVVS